MNKSKQEAGTIATDSQDDPELQLALMLSREDNHSSATLDQSRHNSYQSIDKYSPNRENPERDKTDAIEIEDSQEDMDDSIRLALEMSKFDDKDLEKGNMVGVSDVRGNVYRDQGSGLTDSSGKKTVISIEDSENVAEEELELKLAIEMSKQTNTPEKLIDTDSDLHVLEAIERSKIDHTPEKAAEFDHHLIAALEMSIQENSLPNADHEDSYLKEVIERSKVDHTPKKVAAYDFELEKAILMSIVEHTPKKVENEDRHLKLAIEQSIVEQSLKLTAVKRKLDTSDMCDIRKKISRNNGDIQRLHEKESDPLNVKEAERFCRTNQLKAMEAREIESEVVILIDSQSQESEEAEMDSLSVPEIADTETGLSDSLSKSLIDNSSLDLRQDQRQIDTTENPSECFRKSPVDTDTHCDIVNDAIDSRRDDDNHEQDDDDDDFIPPSPDKSTSNLSQLNASHQSNGSFTPISTLLSGSRKEETESSKEESESEKLESAKVMRTYTNNGHYEQTEKTNKDRGESKVTDFSLKTSLLRFVDDNASESDYDSCDDDDFDDYVGAGKSCSDNDSFESADDMFTQPDCDSESNVGPKKLSNVQNENTNTVQVPYVTKNVPNIWRVSNLVNLPVRNESSHSPSKLCSKRGNSLERQPNTDGSLFERDKNVSPTKTIVANIKKEKDVDANKVSLENNYSNMDVQKRESNISPKRKGTVAIKQKPSDQIASKIDVQKGFSDFYSTYDSQMDEIDFNPDLDDIDNDPTYEAGKNDMDSSESSDDISDDDEGDDLDELISKVDPEFLPPISRPKKRRKKTPKKDSTKKTATSPKTKSVQIKQENLDGLDVQVKVEKSDRPDVSTETDKALAKLLDKQINKRTGSSTNSSKDYIADNDELFARQVKTEIDSDLPDLYVDTVNDEKLAKQYQTVLNSGTPDRNETEELIRELQRRELEKLERMRRTLEEDERIARMIQDNPDQDQGIF